MSFSQQPAVKKDTENSAAVTSLRTFVRSGAFIHFLIISEWKTKEWHFKIRDPKVNDFKSIILLTNDWDMEIKHGIPYPQDIVHELTGVQYTISMADNIYSFKRPLTNHFLQTFIPSMMLSMISASSVFIPSEIVPGRMALSITSFLSLISLFNGAR